MRTKLVPLVVLVALLGLTACEPGGTRYRDEVFSEVTVTRDITYGRAQTWDGQTVDLRLDRYEPKGDTASRRAAVVFAHGGSFRNGHKACNGCVAFGEAFAKRGFVVVSIDYRKRPRVPTLPAAGGEMSPEDFDQVMDAIDDDQAAVRFLRSKAAAWRLDPAAIFTDGGSAGSVMSLGVGVDREDPGGSGTPGQSSRVCAAASNSGTFAASVVVDGVVRDFLDRGDSPAILFNGRDDDVVPIEHARAYADDLGRVVQPVTFVPFDGGHGIPGELRPEVYEQTAGFFADLMDASRCTT